MHIKLTSYDGRSFLVKPKEITDFQESDKFKLSSEAPSFPPRQQHHHQPCPPSVITVDKTALQDDASTVTQDRSLKFKSSSKSSNSKSRHSNSILSSKSKSSSSSSKSKSTSPSAKKSVHSHPASSASTKSHRSSSSSILSKTSSKSNHSNTSTKQSTIATELQKLQKDLEKLKKKSKKSQQLDENKSLTTDSIYSSTYASTTTGSDSLYKSLEEAPAAKPDGQVEKMAEAFCKALKETRNIPNLSLPIYTPNKKLHWTKRVVPKLSMSNYFSVLLHPRTQKLSTRTATLHHEVDIALYDKLEKCIPEDKMTILSHKCNINMSGTRVLNTIIAKANIPLKPQELDLKYEQFLSTKRASSESITAYTTNILKFENTFMDTKYKLDEHTLIQRWRLGLGTAFNNISHSFDKLGITPVGWESTSLFDLVEEAEEHIPDPPKDPVKEKV